MPFSAPHRRIRGQPGPVRVPQWPDRSGRAGGSEQAVPGGRGRARRGLSKPDSHAGKAEHFHRVSGGVPRPGRLGQPSRSNRSTRMHGGRPYQVYFDRSLPAQWKAKEAEYAVELARATRTRGAHGGFRRARSRTERARPRDARASRPERATSATVNGVMPPRAAGFRGS